MPHLPGIGGHVGQHGARRVITLNPAPVSGSAAGRTTWDFDVDGVLYIDATTANYNGVLTPLGQFRVTVRMWGAGGGGGPTSGNVAGNGGGDAALAGILSSWNDGTNVMSAPGGLGGMGDNSDGDFGTGAAAPAAATGGDVNEAGQAGGAGTIRKGGNGGQAGSTNSLAEGGGAQVVPPASSFNTTIHGNHPGGGGAGSSRDAATWASGGGSGGSYARKTFNWNAPATVQVGKQGVGGLAGGFTAGGWGGLGRILVFLS